MKTYTHKLTNETYTAIKQASKPSPIDSEMLTGVIFRVSESGIEKFMTDHQIEKLLK